MSPSPFPWAHLCCSWGQTWLHRTLRRQLDQNFLPAGACGALGQASLG